MSFVSDDNLVQAVEEIKEHCDEDYAAINHAHDAATASTSGSGGAAGFMSAVDKEKLNGIATGAEVNQNAFANVVVGNDTIAADAKQDTLTLTAGSNVTITADTTNDAVTIAATDTTYSTATPSTSGTGGSNGLMSAADKEKLDGIAAGAQVNTVTGVKGMSESSYRTGNVNITTDNIGAFPKTGGKVNGDISLSYEVGGGTSVQWRFPSVGDSFTIPNPPRFDEDDIFAVCFYYDSNDYVVQLNSHFYYGIEETINDIAYDGELTFTLTALPSGAVSIRDIYFGYSSYSHNVNASGEVIAHESDGTEHRLTEKADNALAVASTSGVGGSAGLMSATDKEALDNMAGGSVTGVKGDSESTYRTGNVNLTAANIGAAASSHEHVFTDVDTVGSGNNAKQVLPYLVFGSLAWTSANLASCKAAVADYRPCVARFSNGAVVEFDSDPQTDAYN